MFALKLALALVIFAFFGRELWISLNRFRKEMVTTTSGEREVIIRDADIKRIIRSGAICLIAGLALSTVVFPAIGEVPAGYRGVVLRFGAVTDRILGEGLYIVKPGIEQVELMPVQILKMRSEAGAASKDLQDVRTILVVNYRLDPVRVNWIYQNLRQDYDARIVGPSIQEAVKAAEAQYNAEDLIQQRPKVREDISLLLKQKLAEAHILLVTMNIEDFSFSPEFDAAIEKKVTMEQKALEAVRNAERQYHQSRADSIEAVLPKLAEAEGIRQIGLAKAEAIAAMRKELTAQGGERYVDLTKAEKWSGNLPHVTGGVIPFMNVGDE